MHIQTVRVVVMQSTAEHVAALTIIVDWVRKVMIKNTFLTCDIWHRAKINRIAETVNKRSYGIQLHLPIPMSKRTFNGVTVDFNFACFCFIPFCITNIIQAERRTTLA